MAYSPLDTYGYIADHAAVLKQLASDANAEFLAYLLGMVAREAETQRDHLAKSLQKNGRSASELDRASSLAS
jgi:hypothetical protein